MAGERLRPFLGAVFRGPGRGRARQGREWTAGVHELVGDPELVEGPPVVAQERHAAYLQRGQLFRVTPPAEEAVRDFLRVLRLEPAREVDVAEEADVAVQLWRSGGPTSFTRWGVGDSTKGGGEGAGGSPQAGAAGVG